MIWWVWYRKLGDNCWYSEEHRSEAEAKEAAEFLHIARGYRDIHVRQGSESY